VWHCTQKSRINSNEYAETLLSWGNHFPFMFLVFFFSLRRFNTSRQPPSFDGLSFQQKFVTGNSQSVKKHQTWMSDLTWRAAFGLHELYRSAVMTGRLFQRHNYVIIFCFANISSSFVWSKQFPIDGHAIVFLILRLQSLNEFRFNIPNSDYCSQNSQTLLHFIKCQ